MGEGDPYPRNISNEELSDDYPEKPDKAMWPAIRLNKTGHIPVAFAMDTDSGKPNEQDPVWLPPDLIRQHFCDIAPTGGGKTTMQVERAVASHFALEGPTFYFSGRGRQQVPEDVIAAMASMPDIRPGEIHEHVEYISLGSMVPGLTFADLRKYQRAVYDRTARHGFARPSSVVRRQAVAEFSDHFAEFIRVANQDPPAEHRNRPLYQLIHLAPEIALDSDWRDFDVVPPRDTGAVCPVTDLLTIMNRINTYVRAERSDKLPVGELDLKNANTRLEGLIGYGEDVFGNIVSGATMRLNNVLRHPTINTMLDNTTSKFSLHAALDSPTLYIIDTSGLPEMAQSLATLTFLNELYLATQQKQRWVANQGGRYTIHVLLDEAPRMMGFEPVQEWMAAARNNRIALDFTLQTDTQFAEEGQDHLSEEMRTNFGTILCRSPNPDDELAQMFRKQDHEMHDIKIRMRDIGEYDRLILSERFEGEEGGVQSRRPTKKVAYYPGGPPAWRDDSYARGHNPWEAPPNPTNPWGKFDLSDCRFEIAEDDPYPFAEDALDHAIQQTAQETAARLGLSEAEQQAIQEQRVWQVPEPLQEQYDLAPEAIDAAVALATAHEQLTQRTADGWVNQARVISRLQYWHHVGSLSGGTGTGGGADDGDGEGGGDSADGGAVTPGGRVRVPSSPDEWETVLKHQPSVTRRSSPPDPDAWSSSYGPADQPVVGLTDYGSDLFEQHESVGVGVKAGGAGHTRLLERGLVPFRKQHFEGGKIPQQSGVGQPDARLFRPGDAHDPLELHVEAEYETLTHPAQLGKDIERIQQVGAFPIILAPTVGPDGDDDRPPDYWAKRVWEHYLQPYAMTPDEAGDGDPIEYYIHRNQYVTADGGAYNGGWTAVRPLLRPMDETDDESAAADEADEVAGTDGGDEADEGAGDEADESTGEDEGEDQATPSRDASATATNGTADTPGAGTAAVADMEPGEWTAPERHPTRRTVWQYHDGGYVLKDGTGRVFARLATFDEPSMTQFRRRYRNRTAKDEDEPDKYEVQVQTEDGGWETENTYTSEDVLKDDYVLVKRPFVPEADLPRQPTPTGAAVLYVDTDPDTPAVEAAVRWYDIRRAFAGDDPARPVTDLVAALDSPVSEMGARGQSWPTRKRPMRPGESPFVSKPSGPDSDEAAGASPSAEEGDATAVTAGESPAQEAVETADDITSIQVESSSAGADDAASTAESDQRTLSEVSESIQSEAEAATVEALTPNPEFVADAVDSTTPIPVRVIVATFAQTELRTYPDDFADDAQPPRSDLRPIYQDRFEPFVNDLPVEGTIEYESFADHLDALFPNLVLTAKETPYQRAEHEILGAERTQDRVDPKRAAKHLAVASYVADAVSPNDGPPLVFSVAREQCEAFGVGLGFLSGEARSADTSVYQPENFNQWLTWYANHLLPGETDELLTIHTDRASDQSLPDRLTGSRGRVQYTPNLTLTPTSTAVPTDPPAQPNL